MTTISFDCDRCKQPVTGLHTDSGTGGFYHVSSGTWAKYGREGEHFVCDACVQSMPEYQAIYGVKS